jgi:hypothetical protein
LEEWKGMYRRSGETADSWRASEFLLHRWKPFVRIAKRDFLNSDTFLDSGGFILFDDSTDVQFGVRKLMPEITSGGRYKLIATNPNHLFQKV